jgi:hypothetical protein
LSTILEQSVQAQVSNVTNHTVYVMNIQSTAPSPRFAVRCASSQKTAYSWQIDFEGLTPM